MHELHAWQGDRRHHAPGDDADAPVARARDSPKHEVPRDPAARIAKQFTRSMPR
jgi:hypothetical protein